MEAADEGPVRRLHDEHAGRQRPLEIVRHGLQSGHDRLGDGRIELGVLDLEQQSRAGVVDEGEHLGEAGHADGGEFLTLPASGIERGDLGGVHSGDAAVGPIRVERAGVRGAVDGGVVHDDQLAVGAHVHIGLDHVRALVDAGHERRDRVLRPCFGRASMGDDQGRDAGAGRIGAVRCCGVDGAAGRRSGGRCHEGDGHVRTPPRRLRDLSEDPCGSPVVRCRVAICDGGQTNRRGQAPDDARVDGT